VNLRPVVLCVMDGIGIGPRDAGDAVDAADTPVLDRLFRQHPWCALKAHGRAVGLPSDADMGNSEVGHNAMGAGRVIDQGATLVDAAIASGAIFRTETWRALAARPTVHFIGLVSDGNVHSHVAHLRALVARAVADGVPRIRVHALTDGRDVPARSALQWIEPLEAELARYPDACIASGGGRMLVTMDRYEADWSIVERGFRCHVRGEGRAFPSASAAIRALYTEDPKVDDQWLPEFVVERGGAPVGRIVDGDAVVFFNFRGDRAIEITRAFEDPTFTKFHRGARPDVLYAGMMQYDGDLQLPSRFLVDPPAIDRTVGTFLAAAGARSFVVSETQKFGHVTYFFNGNRSGKIAEALEEYVEIPSDRVPFDQAPEMQADAIARAAAEAIRSRKYQHVRLNLANGDMVGHTGNFVATVAAVEAVDRAVGIVLAAAEEVGAVVLVTADHGNADEMIEHDKAGALVYERGAPKVRTAHSLNPVPFVLVDPRHEWTLARVEGAGIANIGATVLELCGLEPPSMYLPSLVRRDRPS
jgi:2,3-bisphosphoglycerate-independent phosphoglycerate mutase